MEANIDHWSKSKFENKVSCEIKEHTFPIEKMERYKIYKNIIKMK
jgi:hypothetical protein